MVGFDRQQTINPLDMAAEWFKAFPEAKAAAKQFSSSDLVLALQKGQVPTNLVVVDLRRDDFEVGCKTFLSSDEQL